MDDPQTNNQPIIQPATSLIPTSTLPSKSRFGIWIVVGLLVIVIGLCFVFLKLKNKSSTEAGVTFPLSIAEAVAKGLPCESRDTVMNALSPFDEKTRAIFKSDYEYLYSHSCPTMQSSGMSKVEQVAEADKIAQQILTEVAGDSSAHMTGGINNLSVGDTVYPQYGPPIKLTDEYWFYYIDLAPGQPLAHPFKYIFINKNTGQYFTTDEQWPPTINQAPDQDLSENAPSLNRKNNDFGFSKFVLTAHAEVQQSTATNYDRYAIILVGSADQKAFFLSGDLIYQTLKSQGYTDDNIIYMAEDSPWRGPGVDSIGGTENLLDAISGISAKADCQDEVTIYIATHGGPGNRITWQNKKTGQEKELYRGQYPYNIDNPKESQDWKIIDARNGSYFVTRSSLSDVNFGAVSRASSYVPVAKDIVSYINEVNGQKSENISDDALARALGEIQSCNKALITDACISGLGTKFIASTVPGLTVFAATSDKEVELTKAGSVREAFATEEEYQEAIKEKENELSLSTPFIWFLKVSAEDRLTLNGILGPGVFTQEFNSALKTTDPNNRSRFADAFSVASPKVTTRIGTHPTSNKSILSCECSIEATPTETIVPTVTPTSTSSARISEESPTASNSTPNSNWPDFYCKNEDDVIVLGRAGNSEFNMATYIESYFSISIRKNDKLYDDVRQLRADCDWEVKNKTDYMLGSSNDMELYTAKYFCVNEPPPASVFDTPGKICSY